MSFLPISINLDGKKIVLIGGGRIAYHKIGFLEPFTSDISVIAIEVLDKIKDLGYAYKEKAYEKSDLDGAFLVYACTNNIELNLKVKRDAAALGILTNVVDNPAYCDFVSPAIYRKGHMTVAVGSNAQEVMKSIEWRNRIKEFLESDTAKNN
jgi:precorrin-2 dehydrogenase / sirohydrochlorin ferrochelatase